MGEVKMQFHQTLDPYEWMEIRTQGRAIYLVDNGLIPAAISALAFATLLVALGSAISPYVSAPLFSLVSVPVYVLHSNRLWFEKEDLFAQWVADRGRELLNRERAAGRNS